MKILLLILSLYSSSAFCSEKDASVSLGLVFDSAGQYWKFEKLTSETKKKLRSLTPDKSVKSLKDPALKQSVMREYDIHDEVKIINMQNAKISTFKIKDIIFHRDGGGDCLYGFYGYHEFIELKFSVDVGISWGIILPDSAKLFKATPEEKKKIGDFLRNDADVKQNYTSEKPMDPETVIGLEYLGEKLYVAEYPVIAMGGMWNVLKFENGKIKSTGTLNLPSCGPR